MYDKYEHINQGGRKLKCPKIFALAEIREVTLISRTLCKCIIHIVILKVINKKTETVSKFQTKWGRELRDKKTIT